MEINHSLFFKKYSFFCISFLFFLINSCWKGETDDNSLITDLSQHTALKITTGRRHTCTLTSASWEGYVKCWGDGEYGSIGNGSNDDKYSPVFVGDITNAKKISGSCGVSRHNCIVTSDGRIKCWGLGEQYQLGNGRNENNNRPVDVMNITTAIDVGTGYNFTCALLENKTIQCWGSGNVGQMGNGSYDNQITPVSVSNINTAKALSVGGGHACTLLDNKSVQCWGYNSDGQLGKVTSYNSSSTPVTVDNLTNVTAIDMGWLHSCALLENKTVKCWGGNYDGELGNNSSTGSGNGSNTPVTVSNITTAITISSGNHFSCAVISSGKIQCWGNGGDGQLGNGFNSSSNIPVTVSNINTATDVSVGHRHACAILSNGNLMCWGSHDKGALGMGSHYSDWRQSTPVKVKQFGG